jgi:hypothetical protein
MTKKKLGFASNSDVFSRRGDPWVSDKEGRKDYGRDNAAFENPDMDCHTKATKAVPKREPAPMKSTKSTTATDARRRANIAHRMRKKLNELNRGKE